MSTSTLSPSECRTLALLAAGLAFKDIALNMDVSPNTAKTFAKRAYRKLGVGGWAAAVDKHRRLPVHRCHPLVTHERLGAPLRSLR